MFLLISISVSLLLYARRITIQKKTSAASGLHLCCYLSIRVAQGDTRRDLQQLAWATFQPGTQEILALPTEENIDTYNLQVMPTGSGGVSTENMLVVDVWRHHLSRTFHHEFTASLAMVEHDSWQHAMDWKLSALQSLVSFCGNPDPGHITVIKLAEASPSQVRFRWTNDSLPRQSCPKEDGGTRGLNLQLLTLARLEVDSDNWLQFDQNQEFVSVPLESDVDREEYQLVRGTVP